MNVYCTLCLFDPTKDDGVFSIERDIMINVIGFTGTDYLV